MKPLRIITIVALIFSLGATTLFAQTWGDENEERESDRNWFWNWFFDENEEDVWDNSESNDDIYEDINLKIDLTTHWKFSIGDNEIWATQHYDDTNWEEIKVPSDWENEGFNGYDGYAWYRMHFDGTELEKEQAHFLLLGFIDDVDDAYINGTLVGQSGNFPPRFRTAYNSNRKYHVPTETINFEGDNVISVRVYDDRLSGGLVGGKPGIYTSGSSDELLQDLFGEWKFKKFSNNSYRQKEYDDEDWETILVPSFWDNQGYRSFDGTAWYRKHFKLKFTAEQGKNYYLILGRIDDFDITYLNGQEIGRTDDGLGFGDSKSYQKVRIYKIPNNLLESKEDNVIAVKVHDFGGEGGIYKGPIGIIEEEALTKILRKNN